MFQGWFVWFGLELHDFGLIATVLLISSLICMIWPKISWFWLHPSCIGVIWAWFVWLDLQFHDSGLMQAVLVWFGFDLYDLSLEFMILAWLGWICLNLDLLKWSLHLLTGIQTGQWGFWGGSLLGAILVSFEFQVGGLGSKLEVWEGPCWVL